MTSSENTLRLGQALFCKRNDAASFDRDPIRAGVLTR